MSASSPTAAVLPSIRMPPSIHTVPHTAAGGQQAWTHFPRFLPGTAVPTRRSAARQTAPSCAGSALTGRTRRRPRPPAPPARAAAPAAAAPPAAPLHTVPRVCPAAVGTLVGLAGRWGRHRAAGHPLPRPPLAAAAAGALGALTQAHLRRWCCSTACWRGERCEWAWGKRAAAHRGVPRLSCRPIDCKGLRANDARVWREMNGWCLSASQAAPACRHRLWLPVVAKHTGSSPSS